MFVNGESAIGIVRIRPGSAEETLTFDHTIDQREKIAIIHLDNRTRRVQQLRTAHNFGSAMHVHANQKVRDIQNHWTSCLCTEGKRIEGYAKLVAIPVFNLCFRQWAIDREDAQFSIKMLECLATTEGGMGIVMHVSIASFKFHAQAA